MRMGQPNRKDERIKTSRQQRVLPLGALGFFETYFVHSLASAPNANTNSALGCYSSIRYDNMTGENRWTSESLTL